MKFYEIIALAAGVLWFVFWSIRLFTAEGINDLDALLTLTIVVLPLGFAWLAIGVFQVRRALLDAQEDRLAQAEALEQIEAALARELRRPDPEDGAGGSDGSGIRDALDHLIDLQTRGEARLSGKIAELGERLRHVESGGGGSPKAAAPPPSTAAPKPVGTVPPEDEEVSEPLTESFEADELSLEDFILAMQFPTDADDDAGFRALRRALKDRRAAQIVTSAQDILTLLSQNGIYMDDFHPLAAPPRTWRLFAGGERGHAVAALGGIRDREALAKVSARMREDTIFRDAAQHFLRHFDTALAELEPVASDAEIAALAETRSARAFMLVGRVAKLFG
ncbi:hypothetical protein LX81_01995 [Palleronia aestuarii]|uniref:Uncharacterized protein n=1 Tax=Palleronia aestuarii TaxID=568105 RepID=A0A2W7NAF7_9RHOB|nr:hypothetical protein [Palleronia aestuarii]PZX16623.1 hypothetical protein LX81_01995 [Palleronia aestuarii]